MFGSTYLDDAFRELLEDRLPNTAKYWQILAYMNKTREETIEDLMGAWERTLKRTIDVTPKDFAEDDGHTMEIMVPGLAPNAARRFGNNKILI